MCRMSSTFNNAHAKTRHRSGANCPSLGGVSPVVAWDAFRPSALVPVFFLFVGIKKRRKEFRWRVIARFVLSLPVFVNFGSSFKPSDSSPSPCCLLRFAQTGAPHLLHVCKKLCGTTNVVLVTMWRHGMTRFLSVLSHGVLMSSHVVETCCM